MGLVYRALDLEAGREVAIKMLSSSMARDIVALLRFKREARTASSLSHPNICAVYDIGESEGYPFLVMELLEGETLKKRLARGSCDTPFVLDVATQVAEGLRAAHSKFIVHRDVKPANIFLVADGPIKLLDFGLAKHFARLESETSSPSEGRTVTQAGRTAGTVDYMSPEQLLGHRLDQRTDLFSLGVLIHEVITGRPPFRATSHLETMASILHRDPPPLPPIVHGVEWGQILSGLLAKDPDLRYPDAGALLRDLARLGKLSRGERVAWKPTVRPEPARAGPPLIAVLPFAAALRPGDSPERKRDIEYVCHGLLDELIAALKSVKGVRVVPRTLVLRPRRRSANFTRIGRDLHADAVVTGAVEPAGDRLSISVALFGVRDGKPLWAHDYEVPVEQLFRVRDQIIAAVVSELGITAVPARHGLPHGPQNRRAVHLCLKGRFFWSKRYEGGLSTARQCFEEALREDPRSALAHAGLADTYSFLGFYCLIRPRQAFAIAEKAANDALRLDPDLAEAHTALGLVRLGGHWDWDGAMRSFRRAIDIDPTQALARIYLSWILVLIGQSGEAHEEAGRAQDIDPVSPTLNAGAGYTFYMSRDYERGIRECEKALEVDKEYLVALYVMGLCKAQLGMYDDAIQHLELAVSLSQGMPFYLGLLGKCYAETNRPEKVVEILARLDALKEKMYVPPHCYVYIYAGLNDFDRAFAWQDKAFEDGASPFNYFSPVLEDLFSDPRFTEDLRAWGVDE
jgi:eukaryotic-like serine/threonine-protein kinase